MVVAYLVMWQDTRSRFDGIPLLISTSFFAYTSSDANSLVLVCNVDLGDASVGPTLGLRYVITTVVLLTAISSHDTLDTRLSSRAETD